MAGVLLAGVALVLARLALTVTVRVSHVSILLSQLRTVGVRRSLIHSIGMVVDHTAVEARLAE